MNMQNARNIAPVLFLILIVLSVIRLQFAAPSPADSVTVEEGKETQSTQPAVDQPAAPTENAQPAAPGDATNTQPAAAPTVDPSSDPDGGTPTATVTIVAPEPASK
jgi:hypothetical protein